MQTSIYEIMRAKGIDLHRYGGRRAFRDIYLTRLERITKEGSPYYTWYVPQTAFGGQSAIDIGQQFPQSRKYQPLDDMEITNNDVVDLTLILNGQGGEYLNVPAGTVRPVIGKSLWKIAVRNDDAATNSTLNAITIIIRRRPKTADMAAREQ